MSKPKVQVRPKAFPPKQAEPSQQVPAGLFRMKRYVSALTRSTSPATEPTKHADEDWFQAQTELMEMVGGK